MVQFGLILGAVVQSRKDAEVEEDDDEFAVFFVALLEGAAPGGFLAAVLAELAGGAVFFVVALPFAVGTFLVADAATGVLRRP